MILTTQLVRNGFEKLLVIACFSILVKKLNLLFGDLSRAYLSILEVMSNYDRFDHFFQLATS
jgi:hypothetical protein